MIKVVQNIEHERRVYMAFDYSKLKGRIIEKYGSQSLFAKAMQLSERSLSLKLNGKRSWKQSEICTAIKLLELQEDDISIYFFNPKVQSVER
jgi:hypothetical protein